MAGLLFRCMLLRLLCLDVQDLKYCDSLDPEHKWPASYREADWPARGDDAYPRMQLENRCYESRVFRRMHMELVHRQDSIQVLGYAVQQL